MSLHYILDGYNIIKHSDFLSVKILKDARDALIRFIIDKKPCGSNKNNVTVVFDGISDASLSDSENKKIEILFTRSNSADNRIKKIVEEATNPKRIMVVSDDKEIQFFIKSCGARPMSVAEFISKGKPVIRPKKDLPKIELSFQEVNQINRELAKVWLK